MPDIHSGSICEQLTSEMNRSACTAGTVVEATRARFRECDQFSYSGRRQCGASEQHVRHFAQQHDGPEIAIRIERQFLVQKRINGEYWVRSEEQRVAIRSRLRHRRRRNIAGAAG
jgi:hypothetical protein